MTTTPPYDQEAAFKALTAFTVAYITLGRQGADVHDEVSEDFGDKIHAGMQAGIASAGEVARLRALIDRQRQIHLPMPSTTPGMPVVCQACSLDGAPVPWKCGVWKFADDVLADGR